MKLRQKLLNNASLIIALAALLGVVGMMTGWVQAGPLHQAGGAPEVVSYQGQVLISDQPYNGTGYFKFAVVDAAGSTTYWSNDNTSTGGSEPAASVSLTVVDGLFSLLLGDLSLTGMSQALDESVFNDPQTYLRVWFSEDDVTFVQMPDQKIAAVPYSFQSQMALDSEKLDGIQGSAYQLQVTGSCAPGTSIRAVNADGSVACEMHDTLPVHVLHDTGISSGLHNVVIGSNGLPLILSIYVDQVDSIACHDPACQQYTRSTNVPLPGVHLSSWSLEMAVGADGLVVFTVVDGFAPDVYFGHCDDLICSTFTLTPLTLVTDASYSDIVITSSGNPLITVTSFDSSVQLEAYYCLSPTCGSTGYPWLIDTIGNGYNFGYHVTITADGLPLIAYVSSNTLTTYKCGNRFCTDPGIRTVHTNQTGNCGTPEITTADNGVGMMAMHNSINNTIEFALCQDLDCTSVIFNTVKFRIGADFADHVSIIKGQDGLPLITYQDMKSGVDGVYVSHCGNRTCSASTSNQLMTGYYGEHNELTIGTDGMPFITFDGDEFSPTLFMMHCSNAFCAPFWRGW